VVAIIIFFGEENISFEAILVMYINKTNIPPIMIMNRMYENQNLLNIVPLIKHIKVVWVSRISPIAIGCFVCVNSMLIVILIVINCFISQGVFYIKY
jgi:hypothetical protein